MESPHGASALRFLATCTHIALPDISNHVSRIGFQVSDFEIRILDFENKEAGSQWYK